MSLPTNTAKNKYNEKERIIKVFMNVVAKSSTLTSSFSLLERELPDPLFNFPQTWKTLLILERSSEDRMMVCVKSCPAAVMHSFHNHQSL